MIEEQKALDLVQFIRMREHHRKASLKPPGKYWPKMTVKPDPIISKYRFCNVRRNDDRVSKYVIGELLPRHRHFTWFAAMVARLFNQPDTLEAIDSCACPFNGRKMALILHKRSQAGMRLFNGAYIVSTNGHTGNKVDYLIANVLTPAWEQRMEIDKKIKAATTLGQAHAVLCSLNGLASFMAAQVLADIKYLEPNGRWADFATFAASGPGSRRGLNRVCGKDKDAPWNEFTFRETLGTLRTVVNARLRVEALTAQDLQNCLCEFDKYERARLGTGTPKQIYTPHKEMK